MSASNEGSPEDGTPPSRAFDALSHPLRCRLLESLRKHNPLAVDEVLADGAVGNGDRSRAIDLHHNHLPRLDEAGYVRWDREEGTLERGSRFDEIEPLLQFLIDHDEGLDGRS